MSTTESYRTAPSRHPCPPEHPSNQPQQLGRNRTAASAQPPPNAAQAPLIGAVVRNPAALIADISPCST